MPKVVSTDQSLGQNTSRKYLKRVSITGLILSVLGLADATYLTIAHYSTTVSLVCPETKFVNCAKVTTSSYSMIHGVPVAVFGLVFFAVMILLQLPVAWESANQRLRSFRVLFAIVGMLSVFYLVYVELFKLNAICLYCTGAHILTFCVFAITLIGTSIIKPNNTPVT